MRRLSVPILAVLTLLCGSVSVDAQETHQRRLDPSTSLLIPEIAVIAEAEEETVTLGMILPTDMRPEANRGADVRKGDVVLMMNGERIRSISKLRQLYEDLEEGDGIKLALKREERRFLVGFDKGAEGGSGVFVSRGHGGHGGHGGGGTAVMVRMGGGGEMEFLHEARVILGEKDGGVQVSTVIHDGELREGDVVAAVNGQDVASLAEYREIYGALAIGDELELAVVRGDQRIDVGLTKEAMPAGMSIR